MPTTINCPKCNKEIACTLPACPHCGQAGTEFQAIAIRKNLAKSTPSEFDSGPVHFGWDITSTGDRGGPVKAKVAELEPKLSHYFPTTQLRISGGSGVVSIAFATNCRGNADVKRIEREIATILKNNNFTFTQTKPFRCLQCRSLLPWTAMAGQKCYHCDTVLVDPLKP